MFHFFSRNVEIYGYSFNTNKRKEKINVLVFVFIVLSKNWSFLQKMLYFLSNIMMAKLHSSNHDEKKTAFLKNVFDSCLYQFISVHSIHFNFVKDSKLQCKKMSFSFISLP